MKFICETCTRSHDTLVEKCLGCGGSVFKPQGDFLKFCVTCKTSLGKSDNCPTCGKPSVTYDEYQVAAGNPKVLEVLKDPALFEKIVETELDKTIEGEKEARAAIFLFSCITKVKNRGKGACNNLLVNADSSSGKDYVTSAVCDLWPTENVQALLRASAHIFTYWHSDTPDFSWDGKICRLADISDALVKSDAFKTFLSDEGKSVIVNKNKSGQTGAFEYEVKGKAVIIATTANATPSDELLNRFNIVGLDESTGQTQAINRRRSREAAGKAIENAKYDSAVLTALAKIQPVEVVITFAEQLEPHLPTDIRARRDVPRIFNLVKASAALHQFQRKKDAKGRTLAEAQDYEIARKALQKIQTGQFVSLTRALRKVYEAALAWKEKHDKSFSVKELYAFRPVCGERTLYDHLGELARRGLLIIECSTTEHSDKPVTFYKPVQMGLTSINLPKYENLVKIAIGSKGSNPNPPGGQTSLDNFSSNTSNPSNAKGIEGIEPIVVRKYDENPSPSLVKILMDVPAFVGADLATLGPLQAGETASLPTQDAETLIMRGIATPANTEVFKND